MTQEERDLISRFVARVGGAPQGGNFLSGSGGSVPQQQAPLPPIDREADQFIADQFAQHPEARYRITQMAVVQEAALTEMNNRLQRMQWELAQAHQQQQAAPAKSGGIFGGLFGGGAQAPRGPQPGQQGPWGAAGGYGQQPQYAPPQPQYPPQYQPGMFNRGGSGFLGSALTTAAGVAGGMVVGNALMNAFSGGHGGEAMAAPAGGFLGGADAGTNAFDGAGVDPGQDFTSGFGNDQGGFGGGGFDGGGGGGFDGGGGGGFDGGGGGGFDGGGGGFDNG